MRIDAHVRALIKRISVIQACASSSLRLKRCTDWACAESIHEKRYPVGLSINALHLQMNPCMSSAGLQHLGGETAIHAPVKKPDALGIDCPSLGHARKPTILSRLSLDLLFDFTSNLLCLIFDALCHRFRFQLKNPDGSKLLSAFSDDFEAAVFDELTDVSVPPATVFVSVLRRCHIQKFVHPSNVTATVFKKQDPGIRV